MVDREEVEKQPQVKQGYKWFFTMKVGFSILGIRFTHPRLTGIKQGRTWGVTAVIFLLGIIYSLAYFSDSYVIPALDSWELYL